MLTNATILRIDGAPAVLPDGSVVYVVGASTDVRCSWQQPNYRRMFAVGVALTEVSAVVYLAENQASLYPLTGRVLLRVDGETNKSRLYEIVASVPQVGLGMSSTEVYLKGM